MIRKKIGAVCLVLGMAFLSGCASTPVKERGASAAPRELVEKAFLSEILRHLYRWDLDEGEIDRIVTKKEMVFWVGRLEPTLDTGDRSLFGEILLPQLGISVRVKKADYSIEESGVAVRSKGFKITQVTRGQVPKGRPGSYVEERMDMQEMRDYLFRTRNEHSYADAALVERMRAAVRAQAAKEGIQVAPNVEQAIHLAPLSPVSNECWVFWESGHKLFHFASDIDLSDSTVWQHEALRARIFDLNNQVVVSREEAPGSNRFLARYQVGRALFNCVVLGQRVVIPARAAGQP